MTFEQVRQRHLEVLDLQYQRLRAVVADPKWNMADYRKCSDQYLVFMGVLDKISRLNGAESEAS